MPINRTKKAQQMSWLSNEFCNGNDVGLEIRWKLHPFFPCAVSLSYDLISKELTIWRRKVIDCLPILTLVGFSTSFLQQKKWMNLRENCCPMECFSVRSPPEFSQLALKGDFLIYTPFPFFAKEKALGEENAHQSFVINLLSGLLLVLSLTHGQVQLYLGSSKRLPAPINKI